MTSTTFPEIHFPSSVRSKDAIGNKIFQIFTSVEACKCNEKEHSLLELVWLTINGTMDAKDTSSALVHVLTDQMKSTEFDEHRNELISILENAIWFWATQTSYDKADPPSEQWKRLCVLTNHLYSQRAVNESSAKTVLPIPLLNYSLNLTEDEETLHKKLTKLKYVL